MYRLYYLSVSVHVLACHSVISCSCFDSLLRWTIKYSSRYYIWNTLPTIGKKNSILVHPKLWGWNACVVWRSWILKLLQGIRASNNNSLLSLYVPLRIHCAPGTRVSSARHPPPWLPRAVSLNTRHYHKIVQLCPVCSCISCHGHAWVCSPLSLQN